MGCCGGAKYANMKTNKNYIRSKDIPEEQKLVIVKQLQIIKIHIFAPPRSSINKLFDIFNEYVNDYPNDRTCSSCISAVHKFFKGAVKQWKKDKLI